VRPTANFGANDSSFPTITATSNALVTPVCATSLILVMGSTGRTNAFVGEVCGDRSGCATRNIFLKNAEYDLRFDLVDQVLAGCARLGPITIRKGAGNPSAGDCVIMAAPYLFSELRFVDGVLEARDVDVGGGRKNACLIHQINAVKLENLLEALNCCEIARQAVEMLNNNHIEVMAAHIVKQPLIAFQAARNRSFRPERFGGAMARAISSQTSSLSRLSQLSR